MDIIRLAYCYCNSYCCYHYHHYHHHYYLSSRMLPRKSTRRLPPSMPPLFVLLLALLITICQAFYLSSPFPAPTIPTKGKPLDWLFKDRLRRAQSSTSRHAVVGSDAEAFERVVRGRYANSAYKPDPVPKEVLRSLLELTLRAPSSFNSQPYTAILVTDPPLRQQLAGAMLGANGKRVVEAPVTVVFAADLECCRRASKLQELMRKTGAIPEVFIKKVPFFLSIFSTGHRFALLRLLLYYIKRIAGFFYGLITPAPRVEAPLAWSTKNTMLAVENFMLGATAYGLSTCPMEGFDEARVKWVLDIPRSRYHVPIVLSLGYPAQDSAEKSTLRYPIEEMFHLDKYGQSFPSLA